MAYGSPESCKISRSSLRGAPSTKIDSNIRKMPIKSKTSRMNRNMIVQSVMKAISLLCFKIKGAAHRSPNLSPSNLLACIRQQVNRNENGARLNNACAIRDAFQMHVVACRFHSSCGGEILLGQAEVFCPIYDHILYML